MVTSCFFCQNLLSDFIEGLLPMSRQDELKKHMEGCAHCKSVHKDLLTTLDLLHTLPPRSLSHEMAMRITEASAAGRGGFFSSGLVSRLVLFFAVPALLFGTLVYAFPKLFPWMSHFRAGEDSSQFVRYFPLLQGASDIIEEQTNWLHVGQPFARSLWEEGGLSPEEFEKSFQKVKITVPRATASKGAPVPAPAAPTKEENTGSGDAK